jgi:WD40 repeat protein
VEAEGPLTTEAELRVLGRFQLLGRVGQGGYGTVWRARDTELGRIVALKVPHPSLLSSPECVERCRREARAAAQLRHPGIVRLYEVVTLEGLPVLVSDFIDGIPLKDLLALRRLTFAEAAGLVADVAEALDYAHACGLVHRDIKPGNLMVESAPAPGSRPRDSRTPPLGRPIVVDFGLALRDEAEIVMTVEGQIIGTPAYMSPEQAAGQGHRVDRRTDIYSLGVVLYELICGERPFRGSKAMLVHQVLHEEPRPPRRLNDRIPRDLETICLKATDKEPGRRYATARAFADDLRRFLRGEPIEARPVGRVERGWRWCRRNPAVALLTSAVVLSLVLGTAFALHFAFRALAEERAARESEAQARREKRLSDQMRYGLAINLAQQAWQTSQLDLTEKVLDAQEQPSDPDDPRGFEWYYLRRLCRLELATLRGSSKGVHAVAFSPDGRLLASAGADRGIVIWDVARGKEFLRLQGSSQVIRALAFSPDGRRLAWAASNFRRAPDALPGEVRIWDVDRRQEERSPLGLPSAVTTVAFSPDGRRLAYGGGSIDARGIPSGADLRVWDLNEHREERSLSGHEGIIWAVAFSPDATRLASASHDRTVRVWNLAQPGDPPLTMSGHGGPVQGVAFSLDGRRLASASVDHTVRIWEAATGQLLHTLSRHTEPVQSVAFSPDGRHLASAGEDRVVRIWNADKGLQEQVLRGHTQRIFQVAFSPDCWRLASASEDQTIKLWDVVGGREPSNLAGRQGTVQGMALSPDGRTLATGSSDKTVKFWDTDLGWASRAPWEDREAVTAVAFSADGRRLASAGAEGTVRVRTFPAGTDHWSQTGHRDRVIALAFHPLGNQLVSAGRDHQLIIWNAETGAQLGTLNGHRGPVSAVSYSPDGGFLASAGEDGDVIVWDFPTGNKWASWNDPHGAVRAVAFSPDGRWLASGHQDQVAILRDMGSGGEPRVLQGHTTLVCGLAFSPDGRRLVTASQDKTVKLWDTLTGHPLLTLEGHSQKVSSVAISSDGWLIASASDDGTVKVWDARLLTPELEQRRQALGVVEALFRREKSLAEVRAHLSALGVVEALFRRGESLAEVRTHLSKDATVSDAVRQEALRLAELYR